MAGSDFGSHKDHRQEHNNKRAKRNGGFRSPHILTVYIDQVFRLPGTYQYRIMPDWSSSDYTGVSFEI